MRHNGVQWRTYAIALAALWTLGGCVTFPGRLQDDTQANPSNTGSLSALLNYSQHIQHLSSQEQARERAILSVSEPTPSVQMRMALLFGSAHGTGDLVRAQGLLESVLKSSAPEATSLHPLARLLARHFQERYRLTMQNEKLAQQVKENARRADDLQEKLEAMADIEDALPARPSGGRAIDGSIK